MWKLAAIALALVPGLFGVVHWMVNAKSEALEQRMSHVEHEIDKGARFTAHDGNVMRERMTHHLDVHARDLAQLRETIDKIRFDDATAKANIMSLAQRFQRIEDRVYTMDLKPKTGGYRNAPYKMPVMPYAEEIWPAKLDMSFN